MSGDTNQKANTSVRDFEQDLIFIEKRVLHAMRAPYSLYITKVT